MQLKKCKYFRNNTKKKPIVSSANCGQKNILLPFEKLQPHV